MHINDFLALLPHEATKSNGETMCRCPCHADKKASLSVKMGDKGIVLHCHAGCSSADIVEALGLKMSDLFAEPIRSDGRKKPARRKAASTDTVAGKTVHTVEPKKPLGKPEKIYHYTDENGKLLFDVMRFRLPDGDKTFRQAIPDPSKPGGYNWSTKDVRHPLYNLPGVIAAIKAGQPVYVVEGEKDADNLIAAGLCATTNPGGASKPGTKIKWLDEHTDTLNGADVIVLPDNDQVGVSDRIQVCEKLLGVAKTIRWIDLLALCPTLPTKGDVSDYLEIAGSESGLRELQRAVQAAPKLNQRLIQELKPPIQQATEAYAGVPGYCVENGVICAMTGNPPYPKPLCSFLCIPRAEITQDDGVSVNTVHLIDGWDKQGVPLPQVRVPTRNYKGMTWVSENWGFRANILPGNTVADKLRYVIAEVGYRSSRRVIEYTHAGWRCIKGKWTYLYHGGAVGLDGVSVDLGSKLPSYSLTLTDPEVEAMSLMDCAETSLQLETTMDEHVSVPLLAACYLAPLREPLKAAGHMPKFSLFLVGEQQSGKSISAELAQYHFRDVSESQFPASFYDTANSIQEIAFRLKDSLLVVDDFHPTNSVQERRSMESMAQRLSRMTARSRLNADGTSRADTPPRCLTIITGEFMPHIGESGVSRFYTIDMKGSDVPKDAWLTHMQKQGQKGVLRKAMRGYIEWLLPQMDELPDLLSGRVEELRKVAHTALGQSAPRAGEAVTMLLLGYEMMLRYMHDLGLVEDVQAAMQRPMQAIIANALKQGRQSQEDRPSRLFLRTVSDLLIGRVAEVRDLTDESRTVNPVRGMIGYMDTKYYYLNPGLSFTLVCEQLRKSGMEFPLTAKALWKQLAADGLILPQTNGDSNTRNKMIDGRAQRLLWIPRQNMDGPKCLAEQQQMPLDFVQADDDPDNPF